MNHLRFPLVYPAAAAFLVPVRPPASPDLVECLETPDQDVYNAIQLQLGTSPPAHPPAKAETNGVIVPNCAADETTMRQTFTINYQFTLPDGNEERFDLTFDSQTIELVINIASDPPFWTELDYHQCPHCPLTREQHTHCPVALNLISAIDRFDRLMSYERVVVKVTSNERRVVNQTSAQEGISSLMGLLIAGSSCPRTHFFKPMARFHLPFANRDETLWRAAATFLLARYFTPGGLKPSDMDLVDLVQIYDDVAQLNDYMVERLRAATTRDSTVNALVHLDIFAKFLTPPLDDSMNQIKSIFEPFLKKQTA